MSEHVPLRTQIPDAAERILVERVLNLILRHVGEENAIRAAAIVEELDITGRRDPEREVQRWVKFLVEERHVAIGTLSVPPYGYFVFKSFDEQRRVLASLVRRARSILEHARALDSNCVVAPLIKQIEIRFPEVRR